MLKAAREEEDVVRLDLRSQRFCLLNHPDHVKQVLQENSKNYAKGYGKLRSCSETVSS